MSTLYIRLPSKAAAEGVSSAAALECRFALATDNGAIEREGSASLGALGEAITAAKQVVAVIAASDVTLLHVQVPPLSAARLRAALPNLVEEQLMSDPSECVLVAGASNEGLRTVAVVNRAWLEKIVHGLIAEGARHLMAVPAQLCLPYQPDAASAAIAEYDTSLDIELAVRSGEEQGVGLSLLPAQPDTGAQEALQTLGMLVPQASLALYVPQSRVPAYQAALAGAGLEERVQLFADNWSRWVDGARRAQASFNLAVGLGAAGGPSLHWRPWRWPLVLVGLALLVNIIGLNIDWLRMKREAKALQTGMIQTYKSVYPKETAILNPILQMRQKINATRHDAGQASPDDFLVLVSQFGEAWRNVMQGRTAPGIAALEYNEHSLQVRLKPDGQPPTAQMQTALAARNLVLTQKSAGVWQIRSAK